MVALVAVPALPTVADVVENSRLPAEENRRESDEYIARLLAAAIARCQRYAPRQVVGAQDDSVGVPAAIFDVAVLSLIDVHYTSRGGFEAEPHASLDRAFRASGARNLLAPYRRVRGSVIEKGD